MKIQERFEKRAIDNAKERIMSHRLTPVVIMAVTSVITARICTKQTQVVINVYGNKD